MAWEGGKGGRDEVVANPQRMGLTDMYTIDRQIQRPADRQKETDRKTDRQTKYID